MENKDIHNYAGVGYIQGMVSNYLIAEGYDHKVKVDGMFGNDTYLGLNIVSNDMFKLVVSDVPTPNYNWNNGIWIFQHWYETIYKQINQDCKLRGWVNSFPKPELDGCWGKNTKACFDYIIKYNQ